MINKTNKEFLSKILSFWDTLSPKHKELLTNNTKLTNFKKGQNIHSGENECLGIILVKKGELRTYILSEEGKEITLYRFNDEDDVCILSASCILNNIDFDVFIDAEKDSEVLIIDSEVFEKVCEENIYAENFSHKKTVDRFSDVMASMQQILFMSLDERVASFLKDEISKIDGDTIFVTHEEIARDIGSAREAVSRSLKSFENKGIIKLSRGKVKVINKNLF